MLNTYVKQFLSTGSEQDALLVLQFCRSNNLFNLGEFLGKFLIKIFPHHWVILNETAVCAYANKNYTYAHELFLTLTKFSGLSHDSAKNIISNIMCCVPHVANRYTYYDHKIVKRVTNRSPKDFKLVTFTITTCKRYDLFEQTMNSFLNCCTDLHKIDKWLCVDDNSSEEDRKKMQEQYPFMEFYFKSLSEKGHPQSMNIIKRMVKTPYIFHMEDDWKFFTKRNYITDCFDVLHSNTLIGQCLINKNYAETEVDGDILGGLPAITPKGVRHYLHEYCPDQTAIDEFYKTHGYGKQSAYWPHFSFRPSLLRTNVLHLLGDYNTAVSHFEMEYAYRYVKAGFVSAFLETVYCMHIGRLTSERHDKSKPNAYELNQEAQFSGKDQQQQNIEPTKRMIKFKIFVVNLDRRKDRWENFQKNDIGFVYERFAAVDGSKLKTSAQLCRIFDGNDFNMRTGMVGCAMSHIKLCSDLINSDCDILVILEDDITVTPNFKDKLTHVMSITPADWDLIYLGHHYFPQYRKPEYYDKEAIPRVEKWSASQSLKYSMGGTGGYVITRDGARKLLDFINKTGMVNCIDTMQQKAVDSMNVYYCTPHLIYSECWIGQSHDELDTDIQFNYNSLSVDIDKRFSDELLFYKDCSLQLVIDFNQINTITTEKNQNDHVYFYRDDNVNNIKTLYNQCIHPCYTLENKILVVTPNPPKQRYFHRFMKGGVYNVDDTLMY